VAKFEKSTMKCVPDARLPLLRLILMLLVVVSIVFQALANTFKVPIYWRVLTDIEFWATISALLALYYAHRASSVSSDQVIDRTNDLMKKKDALIWNEIAISLNVACSVVYFIFMPIIYGSSKF
jgi:hypothetical protein